MRKTLKPWLLGLTILSLVFLAGCVTAGQVKIDPVPEPELEYGPMPVMNGVIMVPKDYAGNGNGLYYDYQDAVKYTEEHKKLRIQNEELIRLLRELK